MTDLTHLRSSLPAKVDTFGERVRHARIKSGLTQTELAQRITRLSGSNIKKSVISKWEIDTIKNPTSDNLFALSDVTGFSARWLGTGKGPMEATDKRAGDSAIDQAALKRAIAAAFPGTPGADTKAALVVALYDAISTMPDVTDKILDSIAAAFAKGVSAK